MGQVLHALDEELDCYKYDTWMCHLPDEKGNIGSFQTRIGNDGKQFMEVLEQRRPQKAVDEWRQLIKVCIKARNSVCQIINSSALTIFCSNRLIKLFSLYVANRS